MLHGVKSVSESVPLDYKLGELLLEFGIVSREQMEQGLRISSFTAMPLGKTLTLLGLVPQNLVQSVVEAQSMLRDRIIDVDQAKDAITSMKLNSWSFAEALLDVGVNQNAASSSRLGELLQEANCLDKKQLEFGLTISDNSGLPLGQVLVQLDRISDDFLRLSLALQRELRAGHVPRHRVIDRLQKGDTPETTANSIPDNLLTRVKLGELFVQAGLVDSESMEKAVNIAKMNEQLLGQYLVNAGTIPEEVVSLALAFQSMLWKSQFCLESACQILKEAQDKTISPFEFLRQRGMIDPETNKIGFGEFMRLGGYLTQEKFDDLMNRLEEDPHLSNFVLRHLDSGGELVDMVKRALDNQSMSRVVLLEALREDRKIIETASVLYELYQSGKLTLSQALVQFTVKRSGAESAINLGQ